MSDIRWLDEREAAAWRGFQLLHARLATELARRLGAESPLSYQDYEVLVFLTGMPEDRMRMYELSEQLGWEKSRTSHHITRMVARGLVEKVPCPSDRRGFFVAVTPEGRREIEAAAPGHVAAVRELFVDRLTAEQIAAVAELTASLLAHLDPEA